MIPALGGIIPSLRPSRYSPCPGWLAWVTLYAAGHGGYIPDLCPAQNNISSPVLHQTVASVQAPQQP